MQFNWDISFTSDWAWQSTIAISMIMHVYTITCKGGYTLEASSQWRKHVWSCFIESRFQLFILQQHMIIQIWTFGRIKSATGMIMMNICIKLSALCGGPFLLKPWFYWPLFLFLTQEQSSQFSIHRFLVVPESSLQSCHEIGRFHSIVSIGTPRDPLSKWDSRLLLNFFSNWGLALAKTPLSPS